MIPVMQLNCKTLPLPATITRQLLFQASNLFHCNLMTITPAPNTSQVTKQSPEASNERETVAMHIDIPLPESNFQRLTSQDWFGLTSPSEAETDMPNHTFSFNSLPTEGNPVTSALTVGGYDSRDSSLRTLPSYDEREPSTLRRASLPSTASEQRHWPSFNIPARAPAHQEFVTDPTHLDVLLGRGGLTNKHPGNIRYRETAEDWKEYYHSQKSKDEKKDVSILLMKCVHDYGGRFLIKDPISDNWVIAQSKQARKKCSQALRESKWKHQRRKKNPNAG